MSEVTKLLDQMIYADLKMIEATDLGTQSSEYMLKDVNQLVTFKMEIDKAERDRIQLEAKIKHDEREHEIRMAELNQKIKSDDENLKLRKEEINNRKTNDKETLNVRKDELNNKKSNDTETLKLRKEELQQKIKIDEETLKLRAEEISNRKINDQETLEFRKEELNQKVENDKNRLMLEKVRSLREQLEKELYSKNQNRNEIAKIVVDLAKTLIVCIGTAQVASGVLTVEEAGVVRSKAFPLIGNLLGRIR